MEGDSIAAHVNSCTQEWFESLLTGIVGMEELKEQLKKLRLEA